VELTTHLPSTAKVKERVELYFYSPSGPSWSVLGRTLPHWHLFLKKMVTNIEIREKSIHGYFVVRPSHAIILVLVIKIIARFALKIHFNI
jgi:hypothetical protein